MVLMLVQDYEHKKIHRPRSNFYDMKASKMLTCLQIFFSDRDAKPLKNVKKKTQQPYCFDLILNEHLSVKDLPCTWVSVALKDYLDPIFAFWEQSEPIETHMCDSSMQNIENHSFWRVWNLQESFAFLCFFVPNNLVEHSFFPKILLESPWEFSWFA